MNVDEDMIERYVRYPDSLTEDARQRVRQFLAKNELAAEIAHFYRSFYEELDALEDTTSRKMKTLMKSILDKTTPSALDE